MPGWAGLTLKTLGDAGVTGLGEAILMMRIGVILTFVIGAFCSKSMLDNLWNAPLSNTDRFDIGALSTDNLPNLEVTL